MARAIQLDDYRPIVGDEAIDRLIAKAEPLRGSRICHMNSTFFAGGVVEILTSMTRMLKQLGINADWRVIRGTPDFFDVTREMHDAIQSGAIDLTDTKKRIFEQTFADNAQHTILDHDFVYMHDHHTIGMVEHYRKKGPWLWRCHLDIADANPDLTRYLKRFADQYSAAIVILDDYKQDCFTLPQVSIMPAIDPMKDKSRRMSEDEIGRVLRAYDIPTDLPIVAQVSRFDRWKDPNGVVDAFEQATKELPATLVMLGNRPQDDPEENEVFDRLYSRRGERVIVLDGSDADLVCAIQQTADVVFQKSLREGFGLTVSEALWQGTPVIGGNVGGIPDQIENGVDGYLVDTTEQAADRLIDLLRDPGKAADMGRRAREKIRSRFLITRLVEDHLDLLNSFEPTFAPKVSKTSAI